MAFRKSLFRNIYKAHVYAGIFVAVHFAILSISGLALLFKDEIQGHSKSAAVTATNAGAGAGAGLDRQRIAEAYEVVLTNAKRMYPADRPLALFPDETDGNILHARLGIDGATKLRGARKVSFDLFSGAQVIEKSSPSSGFFEWMLLLHRELFMGSNGKLYIGFVGLVYVFMLLSGFFIYGKFMKGRAWGDIRPARLPKLVDLHKFAGAVTFGWGLIVGLSGVFLAFNGLLIKFFQLKSLEHLSRQYQGVSSASGHALGHAAPFGQVIKAALNSQPDSIISYVAFPDAEFGIAGHYLVLVHGADAIASRISRLAVVNAHTGLLAEIVELPLYLKFMLLSEPLHFGDYGGLPLKIIWAAFAVCSLAVVLFGVSSFFLKRKMRREGAAPPVPSAGHRRSDRALSRSAYAMPVLITVATGFGIIGSLFFSGAMAQISVAVLLLPLGLILFGRRKNA